MGISSKHTSTAPNDLPGQGCHMPKVQAAFCIFLCKISGVEGIVIGGEGFLNVSQLFHDGPAVQTNALVIFSRSKEKMLGPVPALP